MGLGLGAKAEKANFTTSMASAGPQWEARKRS